MVIGELPKRLEKTNSSSLPPTVRVISVRSVERAGMISRRLSPRGETELSTMLVDQAATQVPSAAAAITPVSGISAVRQRSMLSPNTSGFLFRNMMVDSPNIIVAYKFPFCVYYILFFINLQEKIFMLSGIRNQESGISERRFGAVFRLLSIKISSFIFGFPVLFLF